MKTEAHVEVYIIDMLCDICEQGYMRPTGEAYLTSPPVYPHKCNNCDHVEEYDIKYPRIEYRYGDSQVIQIK